MERNRQNFFLILEHFLPFYPFNNPGNQNFEKKKKRPGDAIILHMFTINKNHYDVWFLRYGVRQTYFFLILDYFFALLLLPPPPPNNPENQNFEKMKKPPGDIIILQMCTIHDIHMMYGF